MKPGSIGPAKYGHVWIIAAFRCECGGITAMADQDNGDAAMLHETPCCERYESLATTQQAIAYFRELAPLPLTKSLAQRLYQNQAHA